MDNLDEELTREELLAIKRSLENELVFYKNACHKQSFMVENTLGMVLYGLSLDEGLPLWAEHTPEMLAEEAASRIICQGYEILELTKVVNKLRGKK